MKTDLPDEDIKKMCRIIYQLHTSQRHVIKLIKNIKSWDNIKYLVRGIIKVIGHVKDFS